MTYIAKVGISTERCFLCVFIAYFFLFQCFSTFLGCNVLTTFGMGRCTLPIRKIFSVPGSLIVSLSKGNFEDVGVLTKFGYH